MNFKILFDDLLATNEIIIFCHLEISQKLIIFWIHKSLEGQYRKMANNTSVEQYVISIITEHYLRYH